MQAANGGSAERAVVGRAVLVVEPCGSTTRTSISVAARLPATLSFPALTTRERFLEASVTSATVVRRRTYGRAQMAEPRVTDSRNGGQKARSSVGRIEGDAGRAERSQRGGTIAAGARA